MKWDRLILTVLVCAFISSCAANVDRTKETRLSDYSEKEVKQKLVPEVTSRKDVLLTFGTPINPEDYNNAKRWQYYSKIVDRRIYFLIPFISDREQFLTVDFSDQGIITAYHYEEK
ncbi:hypothetical protein [Pantoea sp. SOD02]|uniref:hypothetical protein n=1 Tax=Pantoea sp. SOD02 TaxID=2970818 RepID=UPI0021579DF4|nr:hypothetical protein [Pantoea sp. SOD02]UVC31850.1 hypothetical protein NR302_19965 [Pantoea sp. SOD02]